MGRCGGAGCSTGEWLSAVYDFIQLSAVLSSVPGVHGMDSHDVVRDRDQRGDTAGLGGRKRAGRDIVRRALSAGMG